MFLQELPDQADHVRLLDFGMAKFLEGSSSRTVPENLTRAGVVFGTPAYMSPEQVKAGDVDARSDVYAAGILLFELLAGRRPFVADTYEGYMGAHLIQPVPSLAKLRPKIPAARLFQALIERAMAKKPADRFEDAGAMLAGLEAVMARRQVVAAIGKRAARARSRRPTGAPRRAAKPTPARRRPRAASPSGSRWGAAQSCSASSRRQSRPSAAYLVHDGATPVETAAPPAAPPPKAVRPAAPLPRPSAEEPPPKPRGPPSRRQPAVPSPTPPPKSELPAPPPPKPAPTKPPAEASARRRTKAPSEQPEPPEEQAEAAPITRPQSLARACSPRPPADPRQGRARRARVPAGAGPVYEFAHGNPGDPRPWLLLGHAYAQHDWLSDSVDRYVRAHQCRFNLPGRPADAADLLKAAAHPTAARAAARAIRDIYGAEAIPALDKAMKGRAGDREATARLAKLRESLSR